MRSQAPDQDADRAAIGGHRGHVVLGVARLRTDQRAQSRWLAHARHQAHRSTDRSCRAIETVKKGGDSDIPPLSKNSPAGFLKARLCAGTLLECQSTIM